MAPKDFKRALGVKELTDNKFTLGKALIAEALGVFFINYFGCLSTAKVMDTFQGMRDLKFVTTSSAINNYRDLDAAKLTLIALTFGLIIFVLVQTLGHVSGAHLNPAITVGMLVTGRVPIIRGLLYIVVQCLGAIAGTGMLSLLLSGVPDHAGIGAAKISENLSIWQAMGLEFFLGFILVLVVFGVTDPHKPFIKLSAALAIGLTVTVGHLTTVNFMGSSMNPAGNFGVVVITGMWDNHWIYWVGPCLGGVVAALLYTYLLAAPDVGEYTPVNIEEKELKQLDGKNDDGIP